MIERGWVATVEDVKAWMAALPENRRALARLISAIEDGVDLSSVDDELSTFGEGLRVWGITGPPGAGKSTLLALLVDRLREQGKQVAVLAVDPSSPFSGGALLGDRIRMNRHAGDPKVFIRSLATRTGRGGVSVGTRRAVAACGLAGFDTVLVETAGVGQTELGVLDVVDTIAVVLVPEAGDSIQGMKAGILEIGDVFVVNKADRPGADALVQVLEEGRGERSRGWEPRALACSAISGEGVDEVLDALEEHARWREDHPSRQRSASARLEAALTLELEERVARLMDSPQARQAIADVDAGEGPRRRAQELLKEEWGED